MIVFYYTITRIVSLYFWVASSHHTHASVASAILAVVASLFLSLLSYLEEVRSVRPSAVLNTYLLGSSLFDAVQVRTFWLAGLQNLTIVSSVALGLKTVLLLFEALPKTTLPNKQGASISREDRAGIYSLRTFWWINRILWLGRCQILKLANLDFIDPGLKTARYSSSLTHNWATSNKGQKYRLLRVVFSTLKWPLLAPSIPRLILIG